MTTDQQRRLSDALDALDRTARPGPPPGGCPHCWSPEELAALAGPPEALPEALLCRVAAKRPEHWDDFPALYRRVAPRVLRLLTTGRLGVDGALVGDRLAVAGWREWHRAELVAEVLDAWWPVVLAADPGSAPGVAEVLETLALATGSVEPWLRVWAETGTPVADRHLADVLDGWLFGGRLPGLRFGHERRMPVGPAVLAWLDGLPEHRIGADRRYWLGLLES
ncbi:hypothetical protein ACIQBJ_04335 [Kitasatospora sp. NPDC088391]|uniref:hypothetical protein n=1 Tax=Kitasatospora sp. NPDC088391 TaxID=3364074 RepID=UPI00380E21EE